ncbi:MAG TPA: hypothetical protein VLB29_19325 [Nocardioidaceae bacterium]|nr:hypothetical protein [Nocardioidaceae bacterium]
MRRKHAALAGLPTAAVLLLTGCAAAVSDDYVIENDPGHFEDGMVHLDDGAAERLGLETTTVVRNGKGLEVPDTAVFVDPEGNWWVYTSPEPDVYVREQIDLEHQSDGRSLFSSGPEAGTEVVTVGVAELYGVEAEVGH